MDTKDTRIQNLLFLLSAAPLSVGCVIVSDDTDTDAATTGQNTSGATEQTSGATEQATTDQMTSEGTGATGATSADGTATDDGMDGSTTSVDPTGGGSEICVTYGAHVTECFMSEEYGAEAQMYCEQLLQDYYDLAGADCVAAFEDYLACLNNLVCDDFVMDPTPGCEKEDAAIDVACPVE
ncbi:MAG: hypothetical protein H6712_35240 [Myxococcales bacterium]|nr:hypothetical protein [Myxococcales bacterium]MCB9719151.1 hypothetical protein [Myxococcales bacterium]